jgi:small-conductance mechanosensitive channel
LWGKSALLAWRKNGQMDNFIQNLFASFIAALFSATVYHVYYALAWKQHYCILCCKKLSAELFFAFLLFLGNLIFDPILQKNCDLEKGYTIGLIASAIYLIICVVLDIVAHIRTWLKRGV